jgi:ABC-type branched-subunit amino acid transport system substrate-binding protein
MTAPRAVLRLIALGLLAAAKTIAAVSGVSANEIVLGQTAVFSGPAQALGNGVRTGLETAIQEINTTGGVNGRILKLITRDDGYEPSRAAENARALITQDQVFALIGGVGTPTAAQVVPICDAEGVPFVGPFTGAAALRTPYNPRVINLRPSYGQEIERLVALLVDGRELKSVACFYQDDLYGQAGLKALQAALKKRRLEIAALGQYSRNTSNVSVAAAAIVVAKPDAVVMIGTYGACADFIKQARKLGLTNAVYCNISFVGTRALVAALGPEAEGIIISQVVPHPEASQLPVANRYRAALKKYFPDVQPDWPSFEGYLDAQLFAKLAQLTGADLTREAFLTAAKSETPIDLGGITATFGPEKNQGLDRVYVTQVKDGRIVSVD